MGRFSRLTSFPRVHRIQSRVYSNLSTHRPHRSRSNQSNRYNQSMFSIQPIAAIQPNRRYQQTDRESPSNPSITPIDRGRTNRIATTNRCPPSNRSRRSNHIINTTNRSRIPPNPAIASIARGQTVTRRQPTIDRAPDRLSIHHTSIAAISRVLRIIPRRDPPDNLPRHLPPIIVARPPSRLLLVQAYPTSTPARGAPLTHLWKVIQAPHPHAEPPFPPS